MSTIEQETNLINKLRKHCLDKLRENNHKSVWYDVPIKELLSMMIDETFELEEAVTLNFTPDEVWREAADIADFAAMVAEVYEIEYNKKNLERIESKSI